MEKEALVADLRSSGRRSESSRARQAFNDFLHLGPGRTYQALLQRYAEIESPPTLSIGTLRRWSSIFNWSGRASRFDALEEEHLQAENRAYREAIMQNGLALEHERVQNLVSLYQKLSAIAQSDEALWITDVRVLNLGNGAVERVELRRFNGELIRYLRGLLYDIAAETGGRFNRPRLPGLPGKESLNMDDFTLNVLTPSERAEFLRLQDKIFSNPVRRNNLPENHA